MIIRNERRRTATNGVPFLTLVLTVFTFALVAPSTAWAQLSGSVVSIERVGRWSTDETEALGERLFEWYGVPEAQYAVEEYLVSYNTRDFDGTPVVAKSQLFVPIIPDAQERPVLIFASGTTGIADECAPSLEEPDVERWGYYRTNMASYAAQGIITIFPDYVGFHDEERPQRYFSKPAEAHLLLDGYRAVLNVFGTQSFPGRVQPGPYAFTAGYSQGGHAALAAADLVNEYAPDVPLKGAIGFAATANVETLMKEAAYYTPYIIYSYRAMYGEDEIDPDELLLPRYAATFDEDIADMCVKKMELYYQYDGRRLYTERFYNALHTGELSREFPALYRRLQENLSGLDNHGIPVLNVQGTNDIIITPPAQKAYSQQLCAQGTRVLYEEYSDARHRHTRPAGFRLSLEWMEAIVNGETPPSSCDDLEE